jgi:hypothetical protein
VPWEHAAVRMKARATVGPRRMPGRYAGDVEQPTRLTQARCVAVRGEGDDDGRADGGPDPGQSPPLAPPVPAFSAATFGTLG